MKFLLKKINLSCHKAATLPNGILLIRIMINRDINRKINIWICSLFKFIKSIIDSILKINYKIINKILFFIYTCISFYNLTLNPLNKVLPPDNTIFFKIQEKFIILVLRYY